MSDQEITKLKLEAANKNKATIFSGIATLIICSLYSIFAIQSVKHPDCDEFAKKINIKSNGDFATVYSPRIIDTVNSCFEVSYYNIGGISIKPTSVEGEFSTSEPQGYSGRVEMDLYNSQPVIKYENGGGGGDIQDFIISLIGFGIIVGIPLAVALYFTSKLYFDWQSKNHPIK